LRGPDGAELQSILARPKLLGLLSFLACSSPRGFQRRDTLLGLFWAETDQKRARSALRQSLYYLRQSLGAGVLVSRGEEEIGLDPERLWCDVSAFDAGLEEGRPEEALEVFRGDLLAGFFVSGAPEYERWLGERREELRRQACGAAWELAERAGSENNAAAAGHWAHRATKMAPLDENLVTQAIELLDRMGNRPGAVRLYEAFARRLEEELELQPSPETKTLVERIRSRTEVQTEGAAVSTAAAEASRTVGEATDELADIEPPEEVDPSGPSLRSPDARGVAPAGPPVRRGVGFQRAVLIGAALMIVLGVTWALSSGGTSLDPRRVVVTVFANETGDPDLDPLGRMAADWITHGIDESGIVDVVPSTIGLAPRPDLTDLQVSRAGGAAALAEATGAGLVVAGAYYRRGDSVEFQAQVIDARDGRLLSAVAPVSGPVKAPSAAVDSLRHGVVRTLVVVLDPALSVTSAATRPPSLEAYREYLEGLRTFRRVPQQMRDALRYLYRAVELDSAFLAPRFYIVMAHMNLGEPAAADSNARLLDAERPRLTELQRNTLDWYLAGLGGDQMAALEAARARGGLDVGVQALRANHPAEAVEALTTGEDVSGYYFQWLALTEAYHVLGDFRRELREARRAREAHPERLRMLDAELRALAALGRIRDVEQGLDASLLLPIEEVITQAHLMRSAAAELRAHGSHQASLDVADRATEWFRSRPARATRTWTHRLGLAIAHYQRERWEEARALFEELASEDASDLDVQGFLGSLAARRGDRVEAARIKDRLDGFSNPYDLGAVSLRQARIASLLGERERAMVLLRDAFARGLHFTVFLHTDMDLEPLHGYPPFEELVRPKG
jgi:DNA-binding SARP family transcriptional activator/TolB-like protein